ncbi:tetratricopeptide repeat protein [Haloflavibacter putidus]|uniref:dolichyl-phosphate-mannose--protein mannosyltransferase n=1 Tax=Haloflavibacter putidus TaxID=2576776 RepID=A0A507ZL46_9FLAO|nr:tetratricopeptide repeat protein [Haloflavibacter putidus]TQD37717.1 tetratricopeptide repeat protein [Haloflavibacter putidus]
MKPLYQPDKKLIYLILFILPFLLYWNAINNEYAIDDNIVVEKVEKVAKGIAGIPEIFTSHYSIDQKQSYGYRPLVQTTFAIEKEFFSGLPEKQSLEEKQTNDKLTQANISHFINLIIYALTGILLFYFLTQVFPKKNILLPALASIIFLLLPIHTEPVNNIKSRDELLLLFFILGALTMAVKYVRQSNWLYIVAMLLFSLGAIFSKESALALLGLVPVVVYFVKANKKTLLVLSGTVLALFIGFWLIKNNFLIETSVRDLKYFENPLFIESSWSARLATGFYSAFYYLKLLLYPSEFSFYYGFSKIPLINWSFYEVWLGLLIFIPLGLYGFKKWLQRDALGLGIALWLGPMLGVINVFYPAVGVIADRFTYLFSVGFALVIAVVLLRLFNVENKEYPKKKTWLPKALVLMVVGVGLVYSVKIIDRNQDWENYLVLYRTDILHLQNSAKANVMLAGRLYPLIALETNKYKQKQLLKETIIAYKNALRVYPDYGAANNNLASLYIKYQSNYEAALPLLLKIEDYGGAISSFNIAVTYYNTGEYENAVAYLKKVIREDPKKETAFNYLYEMYNREIQKDQIENALQDLKDEFKNTKPGFYINLGKLYYRAKEYDIALRNYKTALEIMPENNRLQTFVDQLEMRILNNNLPD